MQGLMLIITWVCMQSTSGGGQPEPFALHRLTMRMDLLGAERYSVGSVKIVRWRVQIGLHVMVGRSEGRNQLTKPTCRMSGKWVCWQR